MGYRLKEPRPHKPRRNVVDLSTPMKLYIHNDTAGHFAIPCWYQEVLKPRVTEIHDRMMHDHFGWPAPDNPDHICQIPTPRCHGHHRYPGERFHYGMRFHHHRPLYHQPFFICTMHLDPDTCNHKGGCKACRHYLDARTVFPIHLSRSIDEDLGEGYDSLDVVIIDRDGHVIDDEEIEADAYIDEVEDWVVRLDVHPYVAHIVRHPRRFFFTIYANAAAYDETKVDARTHETVTRHHAARRDVVTTGMIIVVPSAMPLCEPEDEDDDESVVY